MAEKFRYIGAGSEASAMLDKRYGVSGPRNQRTEFWRELSWRVGDEHANRICWVLTLYCKVFRVDIRKFTHTTLPHR